jgi:primosomal protein N'
MFFYQVLLEQNIPGHFLLYKSEENLTLGQLVTVSLKTKKILGIIIKQEIIKQELNSKIQKLEIDKIKEIDKVLPYIFNSKSLVFLKLFSRNTFNSTNLVTQSLLQPLKLLTKKNWQDLQENFIFIKSNVKKEESSFKEIKTSIKVDFLLELNILLRIIYIIRSYIFKKNHNFNQKTILLVFPEKKHLQKTVLDLQNNLTKKELKNLEIYQYFADSSLETKKVVRELVGSLCFQHSKRLRIIFCNRAGIFLPFNHLTEIVLIDEANSMHIQDQNRIYYDTRDAAYILANSYNCNLTFISSLPSIRLYNFYQKKVLDQFLNQKNLQKEFLNLQVYKKDSKINYYSIFSYQIEEIIKNLE